MAGGVLLNAEGAKVLQKLQKSQKKKTTENLKTFC